MPGGEEMPWYIWGALALWLVSTVAHAKADEEPDHRTPEEKEREERFWDKTL